MAVMLNLDTTPATPPNAGPNAGWRAACDPVNIGRTSDRPGPRHGNSAATETNGLVTCPMLCLVRLSGRCCSRLEGCGPVPSSYPQSWHEPPIRRLCGQLFSVRSTGWMQLCARCCCSWHGLAQSETGLLVRQSGWVVSSWRVVVVVVGGWCRGARLFGDLPHGLDVGLCLFCRCEQDKGSRRALPGRCRRDRTAAAIFPISLLGRAGPFGARPRRTTSIS